MNDRLTTGQLAEAFDALLDLEPDKRNDWLACQPLHQADRRRLTLMLEATADTAASFLDASAADHAASLAAFDSPPLDADDFIGKQFGPFRLLSLLGQGGMATVFLAQRVGQDFEQRVAVKVLRRGLYSSSEQQLFRRERQVLAQLDHPGIARLIDGGVTDAGIPFLAMEHVEGLRLDHYIAQHSPPLEARLHLFLDVCRAVQAAHRSLVVHRDIKPSNILVSSTGTPKLLDFGIAKLLDEEPGNDVGTLTAALTPGYAAPEQISGGVITTAADIYSLGVVLFELLTGQRPEPETPRAPSTALARSGHLVTAQRPWMAPATLQRKLRGDLDNIVQCALAAEPERRYASAQSLADDVESYLDGRPVRAHPPSRWYRFRKFAGRNRAALSIAAALSLATLMSLAAAAWQAHSATLEAQRANAVRDFVVSIFRTAEADVPRDERPRPEDVVATGVRHVLQDGSLPDQTREEMLLVLAQVAIGLRADDAADRTTQALLDLTLHLHGERDDAQLAARRLRAQYLTQHGAFDQAVALLQPQRQALIARGDVAALDALVVLELALMESGNMDEATTVSRNREIQRVANGLIDQAPDSALRALISVVQNLAALHRFQESLDLSEQVLALWRRVGSPLRSDMLELYGSIGNSATSLGDGARGEQAYRDAIALTERLYEGPHVNKSWFVGVLGSYLVAQGRLEEAEPLVFSALETRRALLGDAHLQTIFAFNAAARLRSAQRDEQAAIDLVDRAVRICEQAALRNPACAASLYTRGRIRSGQRVFEEAERDLRAAIAMQQSLTGEHSAMAATPIAYLAELQRRAGHHAEAIASADQALGLWKEAGGGHWALVAMARLQRAWARLELGDVRAALAEISEVESDFSMRSPGNVATRISMLSVLARAHKQLGEGAQARAIASRAIELWSAPRADAEQPEGLAELRSLMSEPDRAH